LTGNLEGDDYEANQFRVDKMPIDFKPKCKPNKRLLGIGILKGLFE